MNAILEKNLITDQSKIIEYFNFLEKRVSSKDNIDLIKFKKALYLIKNSDKENGKNLLEDLINRNSSLKNLAEEIIAK